MTLLLMLLLQVPLGSTYTAKFLTTFDATNAEAPADAVPTCDTYEEVTTTPILLNGAMTLVAATTNIYYIQIAATTGNGFEVGKWYNTVCEGTVGGLQQNLVNDHYRITPTENTSGFYIVDVGRFGGTAVTGRDLGASVLLSSGTGTGQIKIAAGYVSPNFSDINGTLDAGEIGTAAFTSTKFATDFLDSTGLATSAANEIATAVSAFIPTAPTIANLVWDTTLASHLTAGTTGAALNSASSAGDPWSTLIPAGYIAGTAGYILGNQVLRSITINRPVLVSAGGAVAPDWANIAAPTTTVDLSGTTIRLSNGTGTGQVKLSSGYISPNFSDINGTLDAAEIGTAAFTQPKFATNFLTSDGLATDAAAEIAALIAVPTAVQNANQVWDTLDAGHSISGTFGEDLNAAGAASDPLNTMVPGAYPIGTMGYIVGNSLLRTSTNNRPVDVNATGGISIDWAAVDNPTTVLNLSGTTTKNATDIQALLPSALVGGKIDANIGSSTTGQGGFTIRKNVGVANYPFKLFLTGTSTPAPGIAAANIDCFMARDGVAGVGSALVDTTETEIDATRFPGWYQVDFSSTETNASVVIFRCKATTTEPFEQIIVPEN